MKQITTCECYWTIRFYAYDLSHPNKRTKILPYHLSHRPFMQPVESCLRCQFLCRILKALFYTTSSKIKLLLQKMQNFWGLGAPPPDPHAAGALPQTHKTAAPLRISGYAPGYSIRIFEALCLKFLSSPHQNFLDPPLEVEVHCYLNLMQQMVSNHVITLRYL